MSVSKSFECLLVLLVCGLALPMARADCPSLFGDDVLYDAVGAPVSVAIADLDGDGYLDMVVANEVGDNVSVLLNNGDGTFAAQEVYGAGDQPESVAIGDLDGDGDADLAVANALSDDVSVLLNNGDGTFGALVPYRRARGVFRGPSPLAIWTGMGTLIWW